MTGVEGCRLKIDEGNASEVAADNSLLDGATEKTELGKSVVYGIVLEASTTEEVSSLTLNVADSETDISEL